MPSSKHKSKNLGELYMLFASLLFATGGLVLKYNDWNPLAVNGARSLFGFIVIGLFMLATKHKLKINKTVILGAFSYMIMTTLFIVANRLTAAGNVITLQFTAPVWIVIFNWILFHKRPKGREIRTMLFIGVGILCFFYDSMKAGHVLGDITALLSGLFYGVLFMINSMKGGDSLSSVLLGQLAAFLCFGWFALSCSFTLSNVLSIIWLGAFQVGLAYIFFSLGTNRIPPLRASLITGLEPILNPALCALFGFEKLSGFSLIGAAIVIISVITYSIGPVKLKTKSLGSA